MIEAGPVRDSTPEEVAYHEAGHAVVGHRLGLPLIDVDVLPDAEGGNGHTNFQPPAWFRPGPAPDERHRRFVEALVVTFLAGSHAEARHAGFHNRRGAAYDLDSVAREWLHRLPGADLAALHAEAGRLVEAGWPAIEHVAQALLKAGRLSAAEVLATAGRAA